MSNSRMPFRPRVHETDGFMSNLVGYVPVEFVAAYVAVSGYLAGLPMNQREILSWAVPGILTLATPFYIRIATTMDMGDKKNVRGPWRQVIASTIAFPVWVFAIGGPFAQMAWYTESLGAIVLTVVSLLLPMIWRSSAAKRNK